MPFPSLSSHGLLFLGRLFAPPCIQSRPVLLKRLLLHHFFFPHPLTQQVLTAHFGPVFFGQIVVPLFFHRGFVCLERFVLSRGLETSNPLMIESVVEGLGVLHPVHGRFFSFFILSMLFHFFGSWVHGLASSTAQRTLGPRLSISGTASIVALYPLIIARNVIACFMGSIVNAIISTPNYAKRRKRVSDVRPSTLLSRINVTGADTSNVPSVMSGFLFKSTSVIFNRRRGGKGHRGT